MAKRRICVILSLIACICIGAVALLQFTPNNVSVSAVEYSTSDFKMFDKASVRKETRNGIRFSTFIGNASAQAAEGYWDSYEMATLFIPKDKMTAGQELVVGGTYSGVSPVEAKFDGDTSKLDTIDGYANGKFFNAVLELSDYDSADAFNGAIVARTYIKNKSTNAISYLDAVEKAPAYVASKALDDAEDDTNGMLSKYTEYIQISGENVSENLTAYDEVELTAVTNVDGLEPNYSADLGTFYGDYYFANEAGYATVTASVAGGRYSKTVNYAVFGAQTLERMYYAEEDAQQTTTLGSVNRNANSEYLTLKAFAVDGVEYNGKALKEDRDYTFNSATNALNIEEAELITAKASNLLKIKSATKGNVTISVKFTYADENLLPTQLDYSGSDKQFGIYSYAAVRNSDSVVDDDGYENESVSGTLTTNPSDIDYFTSERIEDYYEAGMVYAYGGSVAGIAGLNQTLETNTNLKTLLNTAKTLGYKNSVKIYDHGLGDTIRLCLANNYSTLSKADIANGTYPSFISETPGSYQWKTEAEFDAWMTTYLKRYMYHDAFGALVLEDEPSAIEMPLVAEMYKSAKRIFKNSGLTNKKIICNLNPLYTSSTLWDSTSVTSYQEGYRNYIALWLDRSGADEVQMDIYSLYQPGIYREHIVNLQIAAEEAAKRGAKISVINSSWQRVKDGWQPDERFHTYEDMAWMNNITTAYGAGNFGYYTYHTLNDENGQIVADGASPINRSGKRTEIYDYVREINAKAQVLAPVILNFDYQKGAYYSSVNTYNSYYAMTNTYKNSSSYMNNGFTKLTVPSLSGTYNWLINELKDSDKGNYMYAVMNTFDTLKGSTYANKKETITLTFASEYDYAWVYYNGRFTVEELKANNQLIISDLAPGECKYVIPFTYSPRPADTDYITQPTWGNSAWG